MQLFINECSLESQYSELSTFRAAVLTVLELAKAIQDDFDTCRSYYAEDHLNAFEYTARPGESFMIAFNGIGDPGFKMRVRQLLFEELHVRDWHSEQVHDSEILYACFSEYCTGTSIAEVAERVLQSREEAIILLNFTPSKFDGKTGVVVTKDELEEIDVDCSNTRETLAAWLRKIKQLTPVYDPTSIEPPRDEQTVLTDITRFRLTPYRKQGRKVYEDLVTHNKMYVDNMHYGIAAHIEVFSRHNRHLGVASLDGTIDESEMKPGREFIPD